MPATTRSIILLAALIFVAPVMAADFKISPGADAQEKAQEALILAKPGQTIEFTEGTFDFTMSLSLDVDDVVVQGAGIDKTILSFKDQDAGAEGLIVTSDGVTLRDFAVEDSKGDAIKAKGCDGIYFINVRTEWTGGPKSTNGAYGFYPVESSNVLIDGCAAIGASDAGIYVGQSKNIIVRNSRAEYNVAGIEIENSYYADVYDNVATHNTGGILVFDLPGLPQQGGHDVRVFNNTIVNNDTANFAPEGNMVGAVAKGTGLMIMANRNVEAFENKIDGNETYNLLIISYHTTEREIKDENYDPYPLGIHIHHNDIGDGGREPDNKRGKFVASLTGTPVPDIVWDGYVDESRMDDGALPKELGIYIHDNGDANFANLGMPASLAGGKANKSLVKHDLAAHAGSLPSLKPVVIDGIEGAGD
jgi:parallel beta-helix repeat protein